MPIKPRTLLVLSPLFALLACTTVPEGPSTMVLPGTGKTFEVFQQDDVVCRQFAKNQLGTTPNQMSIEDSAKSAALTAVLGAIAGAVIDGGRGAAVGAGVGAAMGGVAGASSGSGSAQMGQRRYDNYYMQCMFAKGNRIPTAGNFSDTSSQTRAGRGHPQGSHPPPPPNTTTPPPPQYVTPDTNAVQPGNSAPATTAPPAKGNAS
ncbi:MAG: hypothetical protein LBK01_00325 [Burkholderiaceae bacterium]|nr:hypothetical protein [Burkholderiaceae bacterium]